MDNSDSHFVADTNVVRAWQVVAAVVVVYDHVLTFDQEVEYIWVRLFTITSIGHNIKPHAKKRNWSLSKVLFLMNRYTTEALLGVHLNNDIGKCQSSFIIVILILNQFLRYLFPLFAYRCVKLFNVQGYLHMFLIWLASFVMMMRISAIYSHARPTVIILISLFIGEVVAMLVVIIITLKDVQASAYSSDLICNPLSIAKFFHGFWAVPAIVETILFGFVIRSGLRRLGTKKMWTGSAVLDVVLRDHLVYFLISEVLFLCNVGSTAYLLTYRGHIEGSGNVPWLQIPYSLSLAGLSTLVSRLIINLQSVYYRPTHHSEVGTMSSLRWGHHNQGQETYTNHADF
ncbi:hypothetical protein K435DRAFT_834820 [Dendrothele bispora CBS 962.96]|uniref:DUF6533 domain-containing protein n=1 Tax=Dendrothele bispora (strain CBS 962.96) TaxID=1314807 RepID=A0A4S8MQW3_DENBC|nr:hypothetical protein K435DRAFT_834820 [Dendrothele bispora CBS 962.96]